MHLVLTRGNYGKMCLLMDPSVVIEFLFPNWTIFGLNLSLSLRDLVTTEDYGRGLV